MRLVLALFLSSFAGAQEEYGAKGIFPVYETAGQWVIFDKKPNKEKPTPIGPGERFLVVGSEGAQLFEVKRASGTYGGMCRGRKSLKLRAGLLVGPRSQVGRPIIGIRVPESFTLKGSQAKYLALKNGVTDATYQDYGEALRVAALGDVRDGKFAGVTEEPKPEEVQTKIDFGARVSIAGLREPFVFVEETQIGAVIRRCLRLAEAGKLVGGCAEMPRALMAETPLLQFVSYDPSGRGSPFVMAFTKTTPMWGDERWGFVVRAEGPRLFVMDAMDPKCRAGF